jgi:hypothetical protein
LALERVVNMTAAIFGLVGVVVGGLITFGTEFFMTRRKERASLRTSARLVELELKKASRLVALWLDIQRLGLEWWEPLDQWPVHGPVLAAGLSAKDWRTVGGVYDRLFDLESDIKDISEEGGEETRRLRCLLDLNHPGAKEARERFEHTIDSCSAAIERLAAVGA